MPGLSALKLLKGRKVLSTGKNLMAKARGERLLVPPTEIRAGVGEATGGFRDPITDTSIVDAVNELQSSTFGLNSLLTAVPDITANSLNASIKLSGKGVPTVSGTLQRELLQNLSPTRVDAVREMIGANRLTPRLLETLDKVTTRKLDNDLLLHHGTETFTKRQILDQLDEALPLPGQTFTLGRFTSTSRDKSLAESRARTVAQRNESGAQPFTLSIEAPEGTRGLDLRSVPQANRISVEQEVVLPRDTIFEVLGSTKREGETFETMAVRVVSREKPQPRIMKVDRSNLDVPLGQPTTQQNKAVLFEKGLDEGSTDVRTIIFPEELSDLRIKQIVNNDQQLLKYLEENPETFGGSLEGIKESLAEGTFKILSDTTIVPRERIVEALKAVGVGLAVAGPAAEEE